MLTEILAKTVVEGKGLAKLIEKSLIFLQYTIRINVSSHCQAASSEPRD